MRHFALATLCLLLAACVSTQDPPDDQVPPPPMRQAELTRLYDQLGSTSPAVAESAARQAAACDDRERRFIDSLWGTRPKSGTGARTLGHALSAAKLHAEALTWLERAYGVTDVNHQALPWIRFEIAREYLALGKRDDAINLLANRLGTTPLPADLQKKYDALIDEASRG
ncbi:MAG: hypothetical protein KF754_08725 [Planctomycetes bacterium]|nr:hypothetical protein [Planctomycetota bacterium]